MADQRYTELCRDLLRHCQCHNSIEDKTIREMTLALNKISIHANELYDRYNESEERRLNDMSMSNTKELLREIDKLDIIMQRIAHVDTNKVKSGNRLSVVAAEKKGRFSVAPRIEKRSRFSVVTTDKLAKDLQGTSLS